MCFHHTQLYNIINNALESEGTLREKAPDKNCDKNSVSELPIKPHEQRALNFLINEYLLARSYKLTSITFSDEGEDQDFEDWQDVGLNIPKPAELLQIYREYMRANGYDKPPSISVAVQTDFVVDEIEEQKDEFQEMVRLSIVYRITKMFSFMCYSEPWFLKMELKISIFFIGGTDREIAAADRDIGTRESCSSRNYFIN